MKNRVYYNEFDPEKCEGLRKLMNAGLIPEGDIDERSIVEVQPSDLAGYSGCHFFAGIGGWLLALQLAGVPDLECWTGSCPCQPWSDAGKKLGTEDERHLWPEWFRLIRECRPPLVFGEQVEAAIAYGWLDLVSSDLEAEGYAVGAAALGAHSVGAPHIRQRLYWVADAEGARGGRDAGVVGKEEREEGTSIRHVSGRGGPDGELGDADGGRQGLGRRHGYQVPLGEPGEAGGLADANRGRYPRANEGRGERAAEHAVRAGVAGAGFWADAEWLWCRDEKYRSAKSGIYPLVDGLPRGVGRRIDPGAPLAANKTPEARETRISSYGDAIVPQVGAEFVQAYLESVGFQAERRR